jgi:hypothetical protein
MWTLWQRNRPNRVAAEVYGARNNTRHEDRKHAVTAEKFRNACRGKKLGEAEVLFVFYLMILVRRILRKRDAAYVPLFSLSFFKLN